MVQQPRNVAAKIHPMPFVRIELGVLTVVEGSLSALLGERKGAPHVGKWALPGGAVRIDLDANLEASAQRVAHERLGVELPFLRQLATIGGKARDPRAPWAISIVYRALIPVEAIDPKAGKRLQALRWCSVDEAVCDTSLAFDHASLIARATEATRAEIERLELPFGFLPDQFTLGELQTVCESILGRRLDKSSFRRRLEERDVVRPVRGEMRTGAFRPAQLYRGPNV